MTKKAMDRSTLALAIYWIIAGLSINGYMLNKNKELSVGELVAFSVVSPVILPLGLVVEILETLHHIKLKVN